MSAPEPNETAPDTPTADTAAAVVADGTPEKKTAASVLVDLALQRYDLGCTPDGDAYAVPRTAGTWCGCCAAGAPHCAPSSF